MPNRNADIDNPARLEAEIRAAMWHHSQIPHPDAGYMPDYPRQQRADDRERIHREIDDDYDRWATSKLLIALANLDAEPA